MHRWPGSVQPRRTGRDATVGSAGCSGLLWTIREKPSCG